MESLTVTFTLKPQSPTDARLINHLARFRTGKGHQERGYELRKLLHLALDNLTSPIHKTAASSDPTTSFRRPQQQQQQPAFPLAFFAPVLADPGASEALLRADDKHLTPVSKSDEELANLNDIGVSVSEFLKVNKG